MKRYLMDICHYTIGIQEKHISIFYVEKFRSRKILIKDFIERYFNFKICYELATDMTTKAQIVHTVPSIVLLHVCTESIISSGGLTTTGRTTAGFTAYCIGTKLVNFIDVRKSVRTYEFFEKNAEIAVLEVRYRTTTVTVTVTVTSTEIFLTRFLNRCSKSIFLLS